MDEAYRAAADAQPKWAALLHGERAAVLRRAAAIMEARREEIVIWLIRESGSTRLKANVEWNSAHAIMHEAASAPYRVQGRILPSDIPGKKNRVYLQPVGVVGLTRAYETDLTKEDLASLADHVYNINDVGAPMSSGSFLTLGMLIVPASMRSVTEIATGVTSSLLTRAADVVLKERRRLVLMVRETPLNLIHLRNMVTITEAGGIIFPPVSAFYSRPTTLEEVIDQLVGRALEQFGLHTDTYPR